MFEEGLLSARVDKAFPLEQIAAAFNYSAGSGSGGVGDHYGSNLSTVFSDRLVLVDSPIFIAILMQERLRLRYDFQVRTWRATCAVQERLNVE